MLTQRMMQGLEADMRCVLIGAVVLICGVVPANAQDLAGSFDQLRVLVKAGDRLTVTDSSGQVTRGRLVRLNGTTLELETDGDPRTWTQDRIASILRRQPDSLGNGAKIGFGIGAAFGALIGFAMADEFGSAGAVPGIILLYGAMGTGFGVWIDGARTSNRLIFSRPITQGAGLSVRPIAGAGRGGMQLTVGF